MFTLRIIAIKWALSQLFLSEIFIPKCSSTLDSLPPIKRYLVVGKIAEKAVCSSVFLRVGTRSLAFWGVCFGMFGASYLITYGRDVSAKLLFCDKKRFFNAVNLSTSIPEIESSNR